MIKLVLILLSFLSLNLFAQTGKVLSVKEVIQSVESFHPQILAELANVKAQKGQLLNSNGAFDFKLTVRHEERVEGYYESQYTDVSLEKPLRFFGSSIFLGHRRSQNDFPVYEEELRTLSDGENYIGVKLSLLKDRDIDKARAELIKSKLNIDIANLSLMEMKLILKTKAAQAYWRWVAAGNKFEVYDDLFKVAVKRQKAFESRVKKGDLAEIYKDENLQYLIKRRSLREKALLELQNSSLFLSFFLRDDETNTKVPTLAQLPKNFELVECCDFKQTNIKNSPVLQQIDAQIQKLQQDKELGQNSMMPQVDLKLEHSDDTGSGPDNLRPEESKIGVFFSFPLEQRVGRGKVQESNGLIQILERKKAYLSDQLKIQLNTIKNKLNAELRIIENTTQEYKIAKKLEAAEMLKFRNGASDFFVVNLRELNSADTNISLIENKLDYQINVYEYFTIIKGVLLNGVGK